MHLGKVGSKGELFPPKELREQANLKEGQTIMFRVVNGRLIVERVYSADEILDKPTKVKISFDELKQERAHLSEELSK